MDGTEAEARQSVEELLAKLSAAREARDAAQRQVVGFGKMIEGFLEIFPALEDLLVDQTLDEEEEPRPWGMEAAARILDEEPGGGFSVALVVSRLERKGWMPRSSNPASAVRAALERLVDQRPTEYSKGRAANGVVYYRIQPESGVAGAGTPVGGGYDDFGQEPF